MATWDEIKRPDETCARCGSVYEVTERHYPVRDLAETIHCECGEILREVRRGTVGFTYSIKKRP